MGVYWLSASSFSRHARPGKSRRKRNKRKYLPSWRKVARRLYDALAACDWSFGRVQEEEVRERVESAMALAESKAPAFRAEPASRPRKSRVAR